MKKKKHGLLTNFLRNKLKKSRDDNEMLSSLAIANKALDEDDLFIVTGGAQYDASTAKELSDIQRQDIGIDSINSILSQFNFNNNTNDGQSNMNDPATYLSNDNNNDTNSVPLIHQGSFDNSIQPHVNDNNDNLNVINIRDLTKDSQISIDAGDGFDVNTLFGPQYKHEINFEDGKIKLH